MKDLILNNIKTELSFVPGREGPFKLRMKYDSISVKENDKEIGQIGVCLGGGIELKDENGNIWYMSPEGLWAAFKSAQENEN